MEDKLNELQVVWNNDLHLYEFKDYLEDVVDDFIRENTTIATSVLDVSTGKFVVSYDPITKITDENTYKLVWKMRTTINNRLKDIATKRKQAVAIMVNKFIAQCRAIETKLSVASTELTRLLADYKPKEPSKKTTYKLVIKTTDQSVIKKLENIALQYGCEISE